MNTPQGSLRKAAILIQILDAQTARDLLAQMGAEGAVRVRQAASELGDVSLEERQQVMKDFLRSRRRALATEPSGIELDDSLARKIELSRQEVAAAPVISAVSNAPNESPPFRFLHEAETERLASFLEREHPQTIAVVVSHLPPERAADVVARLSESMQVDVLSRVALLDQADVEIIRDVERELESLLTTNVHALPNRAAGIKAASAILQAMDSGDRRDLVSALTRRDSQLSERLTKSLAPPAEPAPVVRPNDRALAPAESVPANVEFISQPPMQEILTLDELSRLDVQSIATVFQRVDPQVALLALAGADNSVIDRLSRGLSRKDARDFRRRLFQIGPVRLREVDEAQHELGRIAGEVAATPAPAPSRSRRLALAG